MTSLSDPITLTAPITRGETRIETVQVVKPTTGALRGLKLVNLLQMDVGTLLTLLPRVTSPALLPDEVGALDPADLLSLGAATMSFFASAEQMAEIQASTR